MRKQCNATHFGLFDPRSDRRESYNIPAKTHCSASMLLLPLCAVDAQDKKPPEKKEVPTVRLAIPLGIPVGKATKIVLRGQKLDTATEVRFPDVKATVKILAKGKATVPAMQDAKLIGDTQVELEVTLPTETPEGTVAVMLSSAPMAKSRRTRFWSKKRFRWWRKRSRTTASNRPSRLPFRKSSMASSARLRTWTCSALTARRVRKLSLRFWPRDTVRPWTRSSHCTMPTAVCSGPMTTSPAASIRAWKSPCRRTEPISRL